MRRWRPAAAVDEHWAYVEADASGAAGRQQRALGAAIRSTASCWRGSKQEKLRRRLTRPRRRCCGASRSISPACRRRRRELDAFLADTSPDAYEKVVDRLLASPHYGERWARPWLDLARYADTNGYEKDNRRAIWKYRDWVIDALNRDLPFDQFTIEQIAGDMLPNATVDQKIASGFHRNAMTNEEGGVDPEESRYEVLVDRVEHDRDVWLGTTLACAQCHNHKYDPFTPEGLLPAARVLREHRLRQPTFGDGTRYSSRRSISPRRSRKTARKELQAEIDGSIKELKAVTPEVREAQAQWEQSMRAAAATWTPLDAATRSARRTASC